MTWFGITDWLPVTTAFFDAFIVFGIVWFFGAVYWIRKL